MAKQELGPNQLKWIEALESGEHRQGTNYLCRRDGSKCCLGVACHLFDVPRTGTNDQGAAIFETNEHCSTAPPSVVRTLALNEGLGFFIGGAKWGEEIQSLTGANDHGKSFAEIAAFCREHPEAVFTEPR